MGIPSVSVVMNPPAMQEMQVQSLGWEEYSCLKNPMHRGAWRATVHGLTESDMTEHASTHARQVIHMHNNV